ncbi:MAG: LytR C-terminal domain-containing protein [Solirubrobacteraceae bacterium]
MTGLTLAISLSNSFTKVGAIAAFAALVGIALLSLLVFSQAREIKRLREWAGRAPERAAERDQRIATDASARTQRDRVAPTAPGARVIPRATPLVSAPVSSAVATAANAAANSGSTTGLSTAEHAAEPSATQPEAQPSTEEPSTPASEAEKQPDSEKQPDPESQPQPDKQPEEPQAQTPEQEPAQPQAPASPAPATAAARAASAPTRAPLPPAPAKQAAVAAASTRPASAVAASARPAGAAAPAGRQAPAASTRRNVSIGGAASAARRNGQAEQGPTYYKREGSGKRGVLPIVAGVVVAVVLAVLVISSLKGGGSHPSASSRQSASSGATSRSGAAGGSSEGATNPGAMNVVVLNGTSTAGLAHHLASDLQQSGYSNAAASGAVPSGTHPTTVVEYSSGHRADAKRVAKALAVTQVQPMESSVASLAGSAQIVVIAGADQAAQLGGGGVQSQGEPAVSGSESATGSAESAPAA